MADATIDSVSIEFEGNVDKLNSREKLIMEMTMKNI